MAQPKPEKGTQHHNALGVGSKDARPRSQGVQDLKNPGPAATGSLEYMPNRASDTLPLRSLGSRNTSKSTLMQQERPSASPSQDSQTSATPSKSDTFPGTDTDDFYAHLKSRNQSRTGSIYSISRESFTSHLSQLTSITLPDANSLSESIAAITTATKATRALNDAAEQIQSWIQKASQVLSGLDACDDVEWAADAGREGLSDVDQAISRFEGLIQVYVKAIEGLRLREDAASIAPEDMKHAVTEAERIINDWERIKNSLKDVKRQVSLAIDWEAIYRGIAEEISPEADAVSRHIFEMEERRHRVDVTEAQNEVAAGVEIAELESILGDQSQTPQRTARLSKRYGAPQLGEASTPPHSPNPLAIQEDTDLLELFARMQPLRASLDFLPVKLSTFATRASATFPSACQELEDRRQSLEEQWQRLSSDAETLKRELGEDRWLIVFRNCGKKAISMISSVERSITKLDEALDSNTQLRHAPNTIKKVEGYEAKKLHYCPAIERVLSIIERGIKDRLTMNGEIIRLQHDIQQKWRSTLMDIKNMDSNLEYYDAAKTQQLRDSVSSVMSSDRSFVGSHIESLGSSPPSSIGGRSRDTSRNRPETPLVVGKSRAPSVTSEHRPVTPMSSTRHSSLPVPKSTPPPSRVPRKTPLTRSSAHETNRTVSSPTQRLSSPAAQPRPNPRTPPSSSPARPRWNTSTVTHGSIGHNFRPLAVTEPSPYRKLPPQKHTPTPRKSTPILRSTPGSSSTTPNRRTPGLLSPPSSNASTSTPSKAGTNKPRRPSSLLMSSPVSTAISEDDELTTTPFVGSPTEPRSRPGSSLTNLDSKRSSLAPSSHSRITSAGSVDGTPSRAAVLQQRRKSVVSPSPTK